MRATLSRTSLVCGAVIAAAELAVVFTRAGWIGFLGYTPEWANAGLFLASPLIAGASAFIGRAYLSSEVIALTGARTFWGASRVIVAAWVRVLVVALASHGLVMLIALGVSLAFGPSGQVPWQPFAYAVLPIVVACAIGVALGAVLPHLWSAALTVVVTYGIWYVTAATDGALPVQTGGATISLAGLGYSTTTLVTLLVSAVIVTTAFLSVAVAAIRWQAFTKSALALAAAVLCVTVAGTLVGARTDLDRFEVVREVEYSCTGSAPQICLAEAHSARLDETARRVDAAAAPLRGAGVDLSDVVLREEDGNALPGPDGVLLLPFSRLNGLDASDADYAHSLLRPTSCEDYFASEMTSGLDLLLTAAQILGDWLDSHVEGGDSQLRDDQARELYAGLRKCSVTEASLRSAGVR